ncbi:MAG: DNA-binding protein [Bacteroidaceae bacterium]|nr:DNA-binding protein [Bacteroidaceae bacterium]
MAIKLKAKEQKQYVGKYAGQYRFVMTTELYNKLTERKVLAEAAMRSGISQGTINAAWAAIGEVIKAWATEGHSVAVPGLGTMRFGVRATSVADVSEVSSSLITSRRVIFTPSTDIKDELANTSINITCYDRDGNVIKQVASDDDGNVEDNEDGTDTPGGGSGGDSGTGSNPL